MKKWWLLPVLAVFLAACGNNDADQQTEQDTEPAVDVNEPESEPEVSAPEVSEPDSSEDAVTDSAEEEPAQSADPKLEGLEEFSDLEEHLPLSDLTANIEADNQGKRVILYEDSTGQKVYKSVYVKHDQHVKIIDLKNDGLVYEGKVNQ